MRIRKNNLMVLVVLATSVEQIAAAAEPKPFLIKLQETASDIDLWWTQNDLSGADLQKYREFKELNPSATVDAWKRSQAWERGEWKGYEPAWHTREAREPWAHEKEEFERFKRGGGSLSTFRETKANEAKHALYAKNAETIKEEKRILKQNADVQASQAYRISEQMKEFNYGRIAERQQADRLEREAEWQAAQEEAERPSLEEQEREALAAQRAKQEAIIREQEEAARALLMHQSAIQTSQMYSLEQEEEEERRQAERARETVERGAQWQAAQEEADRLEIEERQQEEREQAERVRIEREAEQAAIEQAREIERGYNASLQENAIKPVDESMLGAQEEIYSRLDEAQNRLAQEQKAESLARKKELFRSIEQHRVALEQEGIVDKGAQEEYVRDRMAREDRIAAADRLQEEAKQAKNAALQELDRLVGLAQAERQRLMELGFFGRARELLNRTAQEIKEGYQAVEQSYKNDLEAYYDKQPDPAKARADAEVRKKKIREWKEKVIQTGDEVKKMLDIKSKL